MSLACDYRMNERHTGLVAEYDKAWREMSPSYPCTWKVPFTHKHRYVNRVLFDMFSQGDNRDRRILDFGCYDGMLIALLRAEGLDVYGAERNPWPAMWSRLGVSGRINTDPKYGDVPETVGTPRFDVVIALNCLHEYRPEDVPHIIADACGGMLPDEIYADREARTPHANNKLWMDDELLRNLGWSVVRLTDYEKTGDADLQRQLLVWGAK